MLQIIRAIGWAAVAVGVSTTNSEAIIVPAFLVFGGLILLKISEMMDKEACDEEENTKGSRS